MSRALFVLVDDTFRDKAVRWIHAAPKDTRVTFSGPKRSLDQNSLLWARLTEIAQQIDWYGQKLTAEDWKDIFTASLRKARIVPALDGNGFVQLGLHTSDMDKDEMSNLLDLIDAFAAERVVEFQGEPK